MMFYEVWLEIEGDELWHLSKPFTTNNIDIILQRGAWISIRRNGPDEIFFDGHESYSGYMIDSSTCSKYFRKYGPHTLVGSGQERYNKKHDSNFTS